MRLFLIDMPVVRRSPWICLSWFWLEEHDCKRVVKASFVRGTGRFEGFWV